MVQATITVPVSKHKTVEARIVKNNPTLKPAVFVQGKVKQVVTGICWTPALKTLKTTVQAQRMVRELFQTVNAKLFTSPTDEAQTVTPAAQADAFYRQNNTPSAKPLQKLSYAKQPTATMLNNILKAFETVAPSVATALGARYTHERPALVDAKRKIAAAAPAERDAVVPKGFDCQTARIELVPVDRNAKVQLDVDLAVFRGATGNNPVYGTQLTELQQMQTPAGRNDSTKRDRARTAFLSLLKIRECKGSFRIFEDDLKAIGYDVQKMKYADDP